MSVHLSPRLFIGIIGAGLIILGLIALATGVNVDYDAGILGHSPAGCGTAIVPDHMLGGQLAADCQSALDSRRLWAWPALIVGAVATLGALFVGVPTRSRQGD